MLKKSLFLALSLLLIFSLTAFAGEGSDTVGGGKLLPQLRYGYSDFDWVTHSGYSDPYRIYDIYGHDFYLQLDWGVFDNVDLIGIVGGRSVRDVTRSVDGTVKIGPEPLFLWGVGVRTTFFRADNGFYLGGGALFTYAFSNDVTSTEYPAVGLPVRYDTDLHIYSLTPELHAGWHIGDTGLTPYLGVDYVWGRARSEYEDGGEIDPRVDNPVFMFVGLDYYFNERLYVNMEGRTNFSEGWGIEGGIGYLFDICPKPAPPVVEPAPPIEPKLEPMSKN